MDRAEIEQRAAAFVASIRAGRITLDRVCKALGSTVEAGFASTEQAANILSIIYRELGV